MGLLQNLLKGMKGDKAEFKQKFKEAQEDDRIMRMVEERKKSSNERELERIMNDRREEQIKIRLQAIRKQENKEMWKNKKTILSEPTTMLKEDRPILKEKNIFMNQTKIPFTKGGENMFFKF